jgi:hypothetical protein
MNDLVQNKKMTLRQFSEAAGVSYRTAAAMHKRGGDTLHNVVQGVETALSPAPGMTAQELARQFGCTAKTVINHANRLFPGKIQNGVATHFDHREITLLLESIKSVKSQNNTLKVDLQGTETALTPALKLAELTELIKRSYEQIDEIKNAEIARLRKENARIPQLERENTNVKAAFEAQKSGLEIIQRIAEAGGLIMSDRDDINSMYRRR